MNIAKHIVTMITVMYVTNFIFPWYSKKVEFDEVFELTVGIIADNFKESIKPCLCYTFNERS